MQSTDGPIKPVLSKVWDAPSKEEDVLEKSIEDLQVNLLIHVRSTLVTFQLYQGLVIQYHFYVT